MGVAVGVTVGVGVGSTTYEIELADALVPLRTVCREVFVHVPETHVISWIDGEVAVIAPAGSTRLRAGSIEHGRFALAHVARRVTD